MILIMSVFPGIPLNDNIIPDVRELEKVGNLKALVLCQIHFQRGVFRVYLTSDSNPSKSLII